MDGGNRKCGGESQENNSLEVIRGIEERISPATQSRNWWGPWSSASVHQNLCAFISTCAPIQTPVPQSRPLKSYANLCTLHLSLPICSQTCTCTLSAEFFPLAPALLMQIHYTGMARDRGGPERGSEAALFLDEDMQQHSTNPNAKQLLQLPQATHVRKDSTYVHQKLPKLRSELVFFLCLKSSRRSIPDGEEYKFYFEAKHGRRERERREHLPPALKKSVRLWIFWWLLYLECQK